jgi:hypothetical protein
MNMYKCQLNGVDSSSQLTIQYSMLFNFSIMPLPSLLQLHCNQNPICVFFFWGIAQPQSQFPHSCVCERFIYSQDRSTYFAVGISYVGPLGDKQDFLSYPSGPSQHSLSLNPPPFPINHNFCYMYVK